MLSSAFACLVFNFPPHSRSLKSLNVLTFEPYDLEPMQGRTGFRPLASVSVVMMS